MLEVDKQNKFLVPVPPHGNFALELASHSANTAEKKAAFIVKLIKKQS